MKAFFLFTLFLIGNLFSTPSSAMTYLEAEQAIIEVRYLNSLWAGYPSCKRLQPPPHPHIVRVKSEEISLKCPVNAIACYHPATNTIYYIEGDILSFGHEYGHATIYHNEISYDCVQELILQQADMIMPQYKIEQLEKKAHGPK